MALYLGENSVAPVITVNTGAGTYQTISKTYTPTTSQQTDTITAGSGYDAIEEVDVTISAVPTMTLPTSTTSSPTYGSDTAVYPSTSVQYLNFSTGYLENARSIQIDKMWLDSKSITSNGTYNASTDGLDGFSSVTVNVSGGTPSLQTKSKTYTPSTSQQTEAITADSGYDGLDTVNITVDAMTAMTLPTSTSSSGTGTTKATVSRSTSDQYINIPTGYNSTAANYKISAVANGSATGPTSLTGSSATVSTGTNTITLTKTGVTTTPTVNAGYVSSATASTATVALTASVTTKAAATITPSTSDQTIASGTYLTGTQTISGDANLIASNIKSGTSIFGVTGTYEGSGGGATNFVTGTFTTGSSTSTTGTVTVPYTGSGYPKLLVIEVEGGAYNSSISGWYNSVTRYAVGQMTIGKAVHTSTPTYSTSGNANQGVVSLIYKNSTSSSTSYSRTSTMTANSYSSSNANGTSTTCVRWKGNNKTISYYVCGGSSSSYGLLASTTYRYYAVYSS